MIVKQDHYGFLALLLVMKGSIVPAILPHIFASALLGVVACLLITSGYLSTSTVDALTISFGPFTALGVAISLFLGFHNNASYSRWWEARIWWGKQIIVTRDIQRFLLATIDEDDDDSCVDTITGTISTPETIEDDNLKVNFAVIDEKDIEFNFDSSINVQSKPILDDKDWKAEIVRLTVAHTHAFRYQMRPKCEMDGKQTALDDRNRFLTKQEQKKISKCNNQANTILLIAARVLGKAHRSSNLIDTYSMIHVQKLLDGLCEIQTACERIHNTSLPLAYSLLVHRTSVLYTLLVPFAIADTVGWWTPVFAAIVTYTFFGLDQLAKEIQEPFRDRPMCLALSAICRTIEIDALEALGKEAPEPLKPIFNVLM